jgi:ParB/RepB/Spo0J family partition protein
VTIALAAREFRDVPLGLIDPPALPSREGMDEERLDELTRDIRAKGILQPLLLAVDGTRFEIVAGHRRYLAASRAGLATVPALVYTTKAAALEGAKYSENRFREELGPAEEAIWFAELLERDCGGDVDRLCEQLGEKRAYVENRLALFQGDEQVFERLRERKITIGVAQALNRCADATYRRYFLRQAIVGGATVAVVTGWIQEWSRSLSATDGGSEGPTPAPAPGPQPVDEYFRCVLCGGTDHVYTMRPRQMHGHCELAILEPLLRDHKAGRRLVFPRTLEDARELVEQILERFPDLVNGSGPARA